MTSIKSKFLNKKSKKLLEMFQLLPKENQKKVEEAEKNIDEIFCNIQERIEDFINHMNECIEVLNHIADCIEKVHKDTTIASVAGSSAGIAGGIAAIVGLALIPVTLGASLIVSAVGISFAVAGGLTGAGSSIVDIVYIKKQCNKAKEVIEGFMKDVEEIQKYLSNIDIELKTLKSLLNTFDYYIFTDYLLKTNLESLMKEGNPLFNSESKVSGLDAFKHFTDLFNLNTLTTLVPCLLKPVAEAVSSGAQVGSRGVQVGSRGVQVASSEAQIASRGVLVAARGVQAATIVSGVFVALGLVVDIVFLAINAKHLHQGAKSNKAANIRSIAKAFEKDFEAFNGKNIQGNSEKYLHEGIDQDSKPEGSIVTL